MTLEQAHQEFFDNAFHNSMKPDISDDAKVLAMVALLEKIERENPNHLTLEELREINEEPIYVTTKNYGDGWCILNWHGVNKSYTYFSRTGTAEGMTATPLSAKTYGDLWLAYRRPPEEVLKDGSTTD